MKHISPSPRIQIIDGDGLPAEGWKIYTYEAGTTTPLATYTDGDGGTANANPVVLDAYGSASIWLNNVLYKFVVKDADDNTVWTIDDVGWGYIFGDNNTWTGTNDFQGDVTLDTVLGDVTFEGSITIDNNLYVTGDLTADGTVTFADIVCDTITVPLITLSTGETISSDAGVLKLTSDLNVTITTDLDGTDRIFDFREDGLLRLPVETPVNDLDAASKGYVDTAIAAAAPSGMVPVAIGAVVSNALVSGAVGVDSINHSTTGTYIITLSDATTSTGKTICMVTIRDEGTPLNRNYTAFPTVVSTTEITVRTGGGNTWSIADRDFNFVVYSLP